MVEKNWDIKNQSKFCTIISRNNSIGKVQGWNGESRNIIDESSLHDRKDTSSRETIGDFRKQSLTAIAPQIVLLALDKTRINS